MTCTRCDESVAPSDQYVCATCGKLLCGHCADKVGCCGWVPAKIGRAEVMDDTQVHTDADVVKHYIEVEDDTDEDDTENWNIEDIGGES